MDEIDGFHILLFQITSCSLPFHISNILLVDERQDGVHL
jgi:hypothetical protein